MAKDTFYFSHDYNTRSDSKIKKLLVTHGFLGYGLFWAIVEDLYNNANALPTDYKGIAYDLRSDEKTIESIITEFELFVFDAGKFGSMSVQRRLDERNEKSIKARESALKRWETKEEYANALPTQSEGNAIKERKGKENKDNTVVAPQPKSLEEKSLEFRATLVPFSKKYDGEMLKKFFLYWTEPTKNKKKLRWELEKTWEISRRLENWNSRNNNTFQKTEQQNSLPAPKATR